jgi:membrane fusion protein, heavy metal efflux system
MDTAARLVVVVGAVSLAACSASPAPERAAAVASPVDTALLSAEMIAIGGFTLDTVQAQPWRDTQLLPGRLLLDPASTQPLGAIAEGRVSQVYVRVGDRVSAGQVVVAIHSHEVITARAGVEAAEAEVRRAESEARLMVTRAERAERLLLAKAMSVADAERARADRVASDAALRAAQAHVEEAHGLYEHLVGVGPTPRGTDPHDVLVRAPISGVITGRDVQPGQVVLPGAPLVTVGRIDRLLLELAVPEQGAASVTVGATVQFSTSAGGRRQSAHVVRVSPVVDSLTRTVLVQATVDTPAGLRAEQFVEAELQSRPGDAVLSVPIDAITAIDGDTVVMAVLPRGAGWQLQAVPVRVGRRSGARAELRAGVEAGRVVIARGAAIAKAELLKQQGVGGEEP